MRIIGFIINPIAGMGGSVGLKGTDGLAEQARERGAVPVAQDRAKAALGILKAMEGKYRLLTAGGSMGEDALRELGLEHKVVHEYAGESVRSDTLMACQAFIKEGADLILFTGGDGTARDVNEVAKDDVPVLGIPSGVKMHSGVFGVNPEACGKLLAAFMEDETELTETEVLDVDEEKYRNNTLDTRLYGIALTPSKPELIQASKSVYGGSSEREAKEGIAEFANEFMRDGSAYIMSAGTTVAAIAEKMGLDKTLLGVDVVKDGKILVKDACERDLLKVMDGYDNVKVIVSPIGAQGFIFGRGNQQISARVLAGLDVKDVIIVSTPQKLSDLRYLLVDTGDKKVDEQIAGYRRVVTGYQMAQLKDVKAHV
ncbi:ATP-NAD kinase family protein [Candidatus Altiarchaeota archaeon]